MEEPSRDAVLVLSKLVRQIEEGRELLLRSAGDNAFGYTADAAAQVSSSIETTLALCRRAENVLQMWTTLSAATTTAADDRAVTPAAIEPLAEEVRRAVREFEIVAEAARSQMAQAGSHHSQLRQAAGESLFGDALDIFASRSQVCTRAAPAERTSPLSHTSRRRVPHGHRPSQ